MTVHSEVLETQTYAVSSVHCRKNDAPLLTIARPVGSPAVSSSPVDVVNYSAIHFREHLPSVSYSCRGSRLVLTCLNTDYPSTVLEFGRRIANAGVHDDSSNLVVHVFLESGLLYSMILTPSHLANPRSKKEEGWISEFLTPSFQIRSPLYMHSLSATDIIFSLQDGGLLRLSNNGKGYNEHIFSDSSYFSSFKSILPWSGRPSNLVISMQACLSKNLLFTLSVDAKLKAWDIRKGQLLGVQDAFAPERPLTFLLDPVPSRLLAVHEQASGVLLVTYCPQHQGLFKLFRCRGTGMEEIYHFREEQPAAGLWRVFDLVVSEVKPDGSILLHVLWKLDTLSLLQTAHINLPLQKVTWRFTVPDGSSDALPTSSSQIIEEFVFTPDRFSLNTLAQALSTLTRQPAQDGESLFKLQASTNSSIKGSVTLEHDIETGNPLTEKFDEDIRLRYLNFAQICIELDRLANEPHSLNYNAHTNETLVSHSDKVSFLRRATSFEKTLQISLSQTNELQNDDPGMQVLRASDTLCQGLNTDSWYLIAQVLREESLVERTLSADDAMFIAYEKTVEKQLPDATVLALQQVQVSQDTLSKGLSALLPLLSQKSMRGSVQGVLGVDSYVAGYRSSVGNSLRMVVRILAYLLYTACSNDEFDDRQASLSFIEYLQTYRQLLLINDTLTKGFSCAADLGEEDMDVSSVTVSDDESPSRSDANEVVFHSLAAAYEGDIPTRDFLDRTMILLINASQASLAVHFSQFVSYTPISSYLKARGLLLCQQFTEAATLFARTAYPLINQGPSKSEDKLEIKLQRNDLVDYHLHIAALFSSANRHTEALRFCNEALLVSRSAKTARQEEIGQRIFTAALSASDWPEAYQVLSSGNEAVQKDNIRKFVTAVCEASNASLLSSLPFVGMMEDVDSVLEQKARNMLDVRAKPSYHKILYACRIDHADYRGAASILYHRLQFLSNRTHVNGFNVADHLEITEGYLAIINALRCLPADDAWIIVGTVEYAPTAKKTKTSSEEGRKVKRKVLRLEDIKKEYNAVLQSLQAQLNDLAGLAQ